MIQLGLHGTASRAYGPALSSRFAGQEPAVRVSARARPRDNRRVRLSVLTADGRELSFAHAGPGNVFGEIAALDGGARKAGATAITHVEVMSLPQKATLELIEGNPKVAIATVAFLCSRLRETDLRLEAIALHRIEVRLARLLLSASQGSNIPFSLGISQGEVGLLIGASRPKVSARVRFAPCTSPTWPAGIAASGEEGKLTFRSKQLGVEGVASFPTPRFGKRLGDTP